MTVSRFNFLHRLQMTALLLAALFNGTFQYCNVWREIQPCSCTMQGKHISITCEKMNSFGEILGLLQNKFAPTDQIFLRINKSKLEDLQYRSFKELNMTITNLKLNNNELRDVYPHSFTGLTHVLYFSLADNLVPSIPTHILEKMPNIATLDLGRLRIRSLPEGSFRGLRNLLNLVLPTNLLERMDSNGIPPSVSRLHIAHNVLKDLNGTLRHLTELQWLFINMNDFTTLDNELPRNGQKLKMIHASHNRIVRLPKELMYLTNLEILFFHNNRLTSLDGVFSKARNLERLHLEHNQLVKLQEDDFAEATKLQSLMLAYNNLTSLNNSASPLINLEALNLTHNLFREFSFEELRGLQKLNLLDISHNIIVHLTGFKPNLVEWESNLRQLRLDHNELETLNGAVSGFRSLVRLDVSNNRLTRICPDDLIGLDHLNMLDISHNQLLTLEETSKTFLPVLQELLASHNSLTTLDRDFHGLPVLCWADLSNNNISLLGRELVSKTHCRVEDGIHSDVWGILRIELSGNPILCKEDLPELLSTMEINHTKISGVGYCVTSDEPVEPRQNYSDYVPETGISANMPALNDHSLNEHVQINPLYSQIAFERLPEITNQVRESIRVENDHQNQIQQDEPIMTLESSDNALPTTNLNPKQQYFVPAQESLEMQSDQGATQSNENDNTVLTRQPLPYQRQNFFSDQVPLTLNSLLTDSENLSGDLLNKQPIYTHIDSILQEKQINQLASEIEQLRTKVQELRSENERLAQNLNEHNSQNANKIFDMTRPILPLEQLSISSTVKPPNENFERTP